MEIGPRRLRPCDSLAEISARVRERAAKNDTREARREAVALVRGVDELSGGELTREVFENDESLILSGLNLSTVSLERLCDNFNHPLPKSCASLSLAANRLVQLPTLSSFTHPFLTALFLNSNQLENLDLQPLTQCQSLERLWLHSNRLTEIDLAPLAACRALKSLYLDHNNLSSVDLRPLADCTLLKALRLTGNPIVSGLNVAPLSGCISLSLFDVDKGVVLTASAPPEHPSSAPLTLPPALRRRSHSIKWLIDTSKQEFTSSLESPVSPMSSENSPARTYSILVAGFSRNARAGIERLLREASFEVTTVRLDLKLLVEPQLLLPYDAVLLEATKALQEGKTVNAILPTMRRAHPGIAIALAGRELDKSEMASHAKRQGANLFNEPLAHRDASDLHSIVARSKEKGHRNQLATGRVQTLKVSISLDSLTEAASVNSLREELPRRNQMEKAAMGRAFERCQGKARVDDLDGIISLLRLPACVSPLLLSKGGDKHFLAKDWLFNFWEQHLAEHGPDERLFQILKRTPHDRYAGLDTVSRMVFFLMIPLRSQLENVEFFQDYVDIATSSICFSMSGAIADVRPVKLVDMRRAELCRYLRAAERGCHAGPLTDCTFEVMQCVRFEFYAARGQKSVLSKNAFSKYNDRRGILTGAASEALFNHYSVRDGDVNHFGLVEFTRFYKAVSKVGEFSALEYFWPILDSDMDGLVSEVDLVSVFRDKARVLLAKGLTAVDLSCVYSNLWDMVEPFAASNFLRQQSRGLSLSSFRRVSNDDRAFVVRAVLFREEDLVVLDLKRTLDVNSPGRSV